MQQSFKGSIPKLAVHAVGARVVESLFLNLPSKETAGLKQEFYGPHFSLFSKDLSGVPTLKSNLESATTNNQKEGAIKFTKDIISKGITKSFFGYTFFQELFAEYIDTVDPSDIRDIASSVADHSVHLLSTRAGTRVVAAIAAYGTPKDRKRICKSIKGYTSSSLMHRDAYLALIRLIQVTDDTVSTNKLVLNEILSAPKDEENESKQPLLLDLALSDTASKFFLFLLVKDEDTRTKYFDPYERSVLESVPMIKDVCTYKKAPEARRQELLKYISHGLTDMCINHADILLKSLPGSRVLKEVYNTFSSKELVDAIISVCVTSLDQAKESQSENSSEELSLFENPTGHWAIKHLILCDVEREKTLFSDSFLEHLGSKLLDVAGSNRGAFVIAALFKVPSIRSEVSKALQSKKKEVKALSRQGGATAGYNALLKEISN
jgi:pumilio family protein 6